MRHSGHFPSGETSSRRRPKASDPSGTFPRAKPTAARARRASAHPEDGDLGKVLAVLKAARAGDYTARVTVASATGALAEIADTVNQIIGNIHDTTTATCEQDWLKTNLAKFTGMMQG